MNPTVKHWIAGVSVIAVIITCVVLFAVFGDTTMPGEAKITQGEIYAMTGFTLSGEEAIASDADDVALHGDYSKKQSMLYYRDYLYRSNIRFNKDKRMEVTTVGKTSIFDYSQSGSRIELKPTSTLNSEFDFTKADLRLKDNVLSVTFSLFGYEGKADFSLLKNIDGQATVGGSDFKFKSYDLAHDDTLPDGARLAAEYLAKEKSMLTNLKYSWMRFQSGNSLKVFLVNGNSDLRNWEFSISGVSLLLTEKDALDSTKNTGVFLHGRIEGNDLIFSSVEKEYTETVTFQLDTYREMISNPLSGIASRKLQLDAAAENTDNGVQIKWNTMDSTTSVNAIRNWAERGLLYDQKDAILNAGSNPQIIAAFERFVKSYNRSMQAVPEEIAFSNKNSASESIVTAKEGIAGGAEPGNRSFLSYAFIDTNGKWYLSVQGEGYPTIVKNTNTHQVHQMTFEFESYKPSATSMPTTYRMILPTLYDDYITLSYFYKIV